LNWRKPALLSNDCGAFPPEANVDGSEDSRFDDSEGDDGHQAAPLLDGPDAPGWVPAPDEYRADDGLLGHDLGAGALDAHAERPWDGPLDDLGVTAAASFVISELLGLDDRGPLAGAWGATLEDGEGLLARYGIDAHVEHGDLVSLGRYLEEGRSVVVAVDADEIWDGSDDTSTAGQALVITRIDEDAGVATLLDPRGREFEVSVDALEDAWADSGNRMVVTEAAGPELSDAVSAASPSAGEERHADDRAERIRAWGPAGAVILPVLLGGRTLIRRRRRA
jgi:hypothetical protein